MVKRHILKVGGAGVLQMGTFGRTWEAPGARSGVPGHLSGMVGLLSAFLVDFDLRAGGRGGRRPSRAPPENHG